MERLTYRDDKYRAHLTQHGEHIYCSTQATADCICKLEEALQSHVPRVMTLEASEQEWREACLWLEIKGKAVTPCMHRERSERMMFGKYEVLMYLDTVGSSRSAGYMVKNYGRTWRCWTSKPTDEQREAIPWR